MPDSSLATALPTIFYGALVTPRSLTAYAALPSALLAVDADGDIAWLVEDVSPHALQDELAARGCDGADVVALRRGEFLIPGFVDTHTHAPQVPNIGR
jgi:guanine deaminase